MNSNAIFPSGQDPVFESFRFDLAFFSCRGIDQDGIYETSFSQANFKKEMILKELYILQKVCLEKSLR